MEICKAGGFGGKLRMASVFLFPAVSLTLWTSASAQTGLSICHRPADADAETAAMAAAQHCINAATDR